MSEGRWGVGKGGGERGVEADSGQSVERHKFPSGAGEVAVPEAHKAISRPTGSQVTVAAHCH